MSASFYKHVRSIIIYKPLTLHKANTTFDEFSTTVWTYNNLALRDFLYTARRKNRTASHPHIYINVVLATCFGLCEKPSTGN